VGKVWSFLVIFTDHTSDSSVVILLSSVVLSFASQFTYIFTFNPRLFIRRMNSSSLSLDLETNFQLRFSTLYASVLYFFFIVVVIVGFCGNAAVMVYIWTKNQAKTVTNLFIANLAIADMLVIFLVVIPTLLFNVYKCK